MDSWLSHVLVGLFTFLGARLLPFLLNWRKQSADEWQVLFAQQNKRIEALETQVAALSADHSQCLETQAELRAEVAQLRERLNPKPKV